MISQNNAVGLRNMCTRDVNEANLARGQARGRGRGQSNFSRPRPRPKCMRPRPRPRPGTLEI